MQLISVKTKNIFTHSYISQKGWKNIAYVWIKFNGIGILCNLIRGMDKEKNAPFYFFELPCFRYRDKKQIWRKINLVNFEKENESKDFQNKAFALIIQQRPDLFREDLINYNNSEQKT